MKNTLLLCLLSISSFAQVKLAGFGNTDVRYNATNLPQQQTTHTLEGWKGEKVNTQLVIYTSSPVAKASVKTGTFRKSDGKSLAFETKTGFVHYVWTDGLNKAGSGCGIPANNQLDSSRVADGIECINTKKIAANTVQPVWVSVRIPRHAETGDYKSDIIIVIDGKAYPLTLNIKVKDHVLPEPSKWQFHLDLWQNPYSIARVHNVKPMTPAFFKAATPYMKMLADAGQKTITVSMIHDPWRSQTYDIYQSMIKWTKKKDGSWAYDYTIFDQWVSYMMSIGIDKLINCYSMVPWNNRFYYYDEAAGRDTVLVAQTGTPEYNAHWRPMLQNFAQHLKQKNWYHKTAIAMDERPLADMLKVVALVKSADKDFKISLAGTYHRELGEDIYDYCISAAEIFEADIMEKRLKASLPTTFYTCCVEARPNTFTFSPPAESTWMGWFAANKGFNGYLRWAYNCWPANPMTDSRFGTWSAGDTYFVYPNAGSSIRFEKLIEGLQDYEKIRILRAGVINASQLEQLNKTVQQFELGALAKETAAEMLQKARTVLNSL
ncbi:DUF4091 domain-containing protein [uncultured Chitinophaga sp.]|uniref:DUF4091 domain-containing protein n=1 Tax=uncultured Chitinophaga sp. TaxID=339340 RepID=UPI0025D9F502|nr:DUF4091 domain-containing protein [uncultured Chitinophaga sp.]